MISLRQHAISLAAVFLALAVGVVLGSGFLSDTLLSSLRDEKRDLLTQITGLNDQKNVLNEKLSAANNFDTQLVGRIVHDALTGKSVVIFRTPDAKDDDVAAVSKIVGQAGGTVTGTVSLTQEFVDANSAEKLRTVVNSSILPAGHAVEHQAGRPGFAGRRSARHRPADQPQPGNRRRRRRHPAGHRAGVAARHRLHHLPAQRPHRARQTPPSSSPAARCPRDAGNQGVTRRAVRRRAGTARLGHGAGRPGRVGERQAPPSR